jgi:ABC-type lipoprotein release transport system permease subunit
MSLLKQNGFAKRFTTVRVGLFLAVRQVRRASVWTNILVVCVMTLTFLNLVVVSGILVGLIEGAVAGVKAHYTSDLFVSTPHERTYIEGSANLIAFAKNVPGVSGVSGRYIEGGTIEANYKQPKRRPTDRGDIVATSFAGIDPAAEDAVSNLSSRVIEGAYLESGDYDKILVGSLLLKKYLDFESPDFPVLEKVDVGDRVRITVNGNTREVWVKGILKSKVDQIDRRVFFVDSQLRALIGRTDYNVDEIAIKVAPDADPSMIKTVLVSSGFGEHAVIQTSEEGEPKFIKDMKQTFNMLGVAISSIGLAVAAITIFIVIFINAITRRKFIGILKGIGIRSAAIEWAYLFQAATYALVGTAVGIAIIFGFLKPYLDAHPINFPFSDGILVATVSGTLTRIVTLFIATLIAGYIPVKIITRQNTLDAILNR